METVLNKDNLEKAHLKGRDGTSLFNCWGATLYVLGAVDELYWADDNDIQDFIQHETEEIPREQVQVGDVFVLYRYGNIHHTAVFTEVGEFEELFHKVGGLFSEFTDEEGVKEQYWNEWEEVGTFRVKRN